MRYLGFIMLLLALPAQAQTITFPIEVLTASDDTTVSRTVQVSDASNINRLWLQVHRPAYKYGDGDKASAGLSAGGPRKLSVQVNGGGFTDVHNGTATCAALETDYDCIDGPFATIRFTVAISGVTTGSNTVDFKFNGTEGLSIGYRVLEMQFLPSTYGGTLEKADVLAAGRITNTFAYENPSAWSGPFTDGPSIAAGETLWRTADLVESHLDNTILAKCADCHAEDGRDLKYFNYSNLSIIERSKFHGLTHTEGEQIASYIRSLALPAHGRVWDPPYQPGPTIRGTGQHPDALDPDYWSAGAGLDWQQENDADAIPYLFPGGIRSSHVSTDSTLNLREIPIAIQLPDWNEWLPRVHPIDSWGGNFTDDQVYTRYTTTIPSCLSGGVASAVSSGCLRSNMDAWQQDQQDFRQDFANAAYFGGWGAGGVVADKITGFQQWWAVKTWEVFHSDTDLQAVADQIYTYGEVRSWVGTSSNLFNVAPHIVGVDQYGQAYPQGSPLANIYFSTAWYEVQAIVNAGNRVAGNVSPMDWRYHFAHIVAMGRGPILSRYEPVRYYKGWIKVMQQTDRPPPPEFLLDPLGQHGFWMLVVSPAHPFCYGSSETVDDTACWDGVSASDRLAMYNAGLRAHVRKLLKHPTEDWPRGTGQIYMPPATATPTPYAGGWPPRFNSVDWHNHFYRAIPLFDALGVQDTLLDSTAIWAEEMWPNGDWETLYTPPSGSPTQQIAIQTGTNYVSSYIAPTSSVMSVVLTPIFGTTNIILDRRGGFYTPFYGVNTNLSVWTTTHGYVIRASAPGTLVVSGAIVDPTATSISLDERWNLVPYLRTSAMDAATALAGVSGLIAAKDKNDNVYLPAFGINDIGNMVPGESYRLYVSQSGSFTYPAN